MSGDIDVQMGTGGDLDRVLITAQPLPQIFGVIPKIEEALKRCAVLEGTNISISANGGAVTLSGQVKTWRERELAERAALSVSGVTVLTNHLRIEA
jgi:hypothetical protein